MKYAEMMGTYPINLLSEIFSDSDKDFDVFRLLGSEHIAGLNLVISSLPKRDAEILELRFKQHLTLQEIGNTFGVSRERIRRLLQRSIRVLRKKENRGYILFGKEEFLRRQKLEEEERQRNNPSIEVLNLDTRSYNALRSAGVHTIPQLVKMSDKEILSIRNMGCKSLCSTKTALREYFKNKAKFFSFS